MKDAGHSTKKAAKDVGHATKKTTKKVVHKTASKTEEGAPRSRTRPLPSKGPAEPAGVTGVRHVRHPCDARHRLRYMPRRIKAEGTVFEIVEARPLARGIKLFVIKAPRIARKQKPGQFVIVRLDDCGERIPLTIADADPEAGTITIVVQAIGKTTMLLSMLEAGDSILDVVGPLGKPSEIENFGTAVVVSGSVGTAMAYPTARELKRAGNNVISIVGARSKDLLVLEDEVRAVSDETYVVTDDGSYGEKGLVTDKLKEIMADAEGGLRARRRPGADDARGRQDDRAARRSRPWSA